MSTDEDEDYIPLRRVTPARPSTRAQEEAEARRHGHFCVCGACVQHWADTYFLRIPKRDDPRRTVWLRALCLLDANVHEDARVCTFHWPASALKLTRRGVELINHDSPPRRVAEPFTLDDLVDSTAEAEALRNKCVCSLAEEVCGFDHVQDAKAIIRINTRDSTYSRERTRKWLKILRPAASASEIEWLMGTGPLLVARHHFAADAIVTCSNGAQRVRSNALPSFRPVKVAASTHVPRTPEDMEVRRRLSGTGLLYNPEAKTVTRSLVMELSHAQAQPPPQQAPSPRDRRVVFFSSLRDDSKCKQFTGEPSFGVLTLLFEYVNARGALDNVHYWHSQHEGSQRDELGGRDDRALTTFESFVLFMCVFHSGGKLVVFEELFAVSASTVRRTYITMLKALDAIFSAHQPWPTLEQARRATPTITRASLAIKEDVAVFLGDATERALQNPAHPVLHGLVYSEYKSRTTIKFNAVAAGNGYICEMSPGYPGSVSDNSIHEVEDVGARIAGDKSMGVVLVYDKGFTQLHHVEKHGVRVITPKTKEQGQFFFANDAEETRNVAKSRVLIEVLFRNCRTYEAFDREAALCSLDLADTEARVVRCLVNMWPRMQAWDLTGEIEEGDPMRTARHSTA
jgi:hypothetical protein